MSRIDYTKWDHIEISDDEDDTHPNVDTASLFRWRHQARLDRMEEAKKEKDSFYQQKTDHFKQLNEIKQKLKEADLSDPKAEEMKVKAEELERQNEEFRKKEEELKRKEKMTPLNVDTICHEGKSRTLINNPKKATKHELTDEEKANEQRTFFDKHEKEIKKFGMLRKYEDSQEYLVQHLDIVSEYTANYLVLWCINLQVEEKSSLMEHVAHQCICMQFMLELAKNMDLDPRTCVKPFFSKIKLGEKQYMDAFNDELEAFKDRIRRRSQERIEEAMAAYEEEERQKRLGPGGLDPVEVFESLPDDLKECFESKDIGKLQEVMGRYPREQAEYHLKRCIDSGMWIPPKGEQNETGTAAAEEEGEHGDGDGEPGPSSEGTSKGEEGVKQGSKTPELSTDKSDIVDDLD